jgi:exopolyphosphatase/guanosine-5'-triphosphate,3'-diphosphate pyrophosphatase
MRSAQESPNLWLFRTWLPLLYSAQVPPVPFPRRTSRVADRSLAVIDVGSNSGRVVVIRIGGPGHLEILANGRAPLRLARDLRRGNRIAPETIERTAAALRDFRAIADSAGAGTLIAVATSAVRESENADEFQARIEAESGVGVRVISGDEEAHYTFLGAVHGLPVDRGAVADLGGGSLELTEFDERRALRSWTLPLGSLRLSDRFLKSDPPAKEEIQELAEYARTTIEGAEVGELEPGERVVGTGGTIRNLAKMDQASRRYPIPRLHGYVLTRKRVQELADLLASRRLSRRRLMSGLSRERADSIVGGGLALLSFLEHVGAAELTVSSQGLREGLAFDAVGLRETPIEEVRRASILAFASRFSTWDPDRAQRRATVARSILRSLEPEAGASAHERLTQATNLLDVGRSVDYYRRYQHTADMITEADLDGFSHRKLALLSAVVRQAGDEGMSVSRYRPLLGPDDRPQLARSATVLALADEIEHRLPPGHGGEVHCVVQGKRVMLEAPVYDPWRREALAGRFQVAFGKRLLLQSSGDA